MGKQNQHIWIKVADQYLCETPEADVTFSKTVQFLKAALEFKELMCPLLALKMFFEMLKNEQCSE